MRKLIHKQLHGLSYYYMQFSEMRFQSLQLSELSTLLKYILFVLSETEIALHKLFLRSLFSVSVFSLFEHEADYRSTIPFIVS